jgi:hypothetical protein
MAPVAGRGPAPRSKLPGNQDPDDAQLLASIKEIQQSHVLGLSPTSESYWAIGEIGDDLLGEKAFKEEIVMAEFFHRVSLLSNCLLSDHSL